MTTVTVSKLSDRESLNLTSATEDCLHALLLLRDHGLRTSLRSMSELLGVSRPTLHIQSRRLEREGLVYRDEKHSLHLSVLGSIAAECVMRRNRLVERFLFDILHVPFTDLAQEANRMEHTISARTERHLTRILGNPQTCPHGNPIAGGVLPGGSRLAAFRFGQIEIVGVPEVVIRDTSFMTWLDRHGLRPGRQFEVASGGMDRTVLAGEDGTRVMVPRPAGELITARFIESAAGASTMARKPD